MSGFTAVNDRLAKIRIKAKFHNISLICSQAPTEEKDVAVEDTFYANLEQLYDKCPAHDINIVLGDFNAKVGQEGIRVAHIKIKEKNKNLAVGNLNNLICSK